MDYRMIMKQIILIVTSAIFLSVLTSVSYANGTSLQSNSLDSSTSLQLAPVSSDQQTTSGNNSMSANSVSSSPQGLTSSQRTTSAIPVSSSQKVKSDVATTSAPAYQRTQYTEQGLFPAPTETQKQAFTGVARTALPMTPDEIRQLQNMMVFTKRAASEPVGTPPKPVLSTQIVNLAPGSAPPVVRLEQGFVTSVVFTDVSGNPWPIVSYDLGNSKAFNIQWLTSSNLLMIQATSLYTFGNLDVTLQGLSTPVMLTLIPGQKVVDYRADLQIQRALPGTTDDNYADKAGTPVNQTLLDILNGVPPQNAQVLQVTGGAAAAWLIDGKLYLRTKLTVLSPGWISIMKNADGTNAYEMSKTANILVSRYGLPVQLKIEGLS